MLDNGLDQEIEIAEDRALESGGGDVPDPLPARSGSPVRSPGSERGTDATAAVPGATVVATAVDPETGALNINPLGIGLQERDRGTGRRRRRVLLKDGMRAPTANLAQRGRRRGKLARSELLQEPSCTVNSLEKHSTRPKSLIYIN